MSTTPGPWHWSISPRFKDIRLDNTAGLVVMDFARWGMQSAQPRFRGALDVMFETSDIIGSEAWPHPDARLIAASPQLLEACAGLLSNATDSYCDWCRRHAPKDDDGFITGPIPHNEGCARVFAESVLASLD